MKIQTATNDAMAMKFGIHNSSWLDSPDPAEAFETEAGVDLLIYADRRNDVGSHEAFASDAMPHFI